MWLHTWERVTDKLTVATHEGRGDKGRRASPWPPRRRRAEGGTAVPRRRRRASCRCRPAAAGTGGRVSRLAVAARPPEDQGGRGPSSPLLPRRARAEGTTAAPRRCRPAAGGMGGRSPHLTVAAPPPEGRGRASPSPSRRARAARTAVATRRSYPASGGLGLLPHCCLQLRWADQGRLAQPPLYISQGVTPLSGARVPGRRGPPPSTRVTCTLTPRSI